MEIDICQTLRFVNVRIDLVKRKQGIKLNKEHKGPKGFFSIFLM